MSAPKHDQPGFTVGDKFYPFPSSFRLGDALLIKELTGMDFLEFIEACDDPGRERDPILIAGILGVAVWRANPRWPRDRARLFVQQIDITGYEYEAGADKDDTIPPSEAGEPISSATSPATSTPTPELPSDPSSPASSGAPA